jgi:hypothetical protein
MGGGEENFVVEKPRRGGARAATVERDNLFGGGP